MEKRKVFCLSGGATGSDWLFSVIGKERGYDTIAYSFKGHKPVGSVIRVELGEQELADRVIDYRRACKELGRAVSNNPYVRNLIIRDYYQIHGRKNNKTELVIAISSLDINNRVKGGTGYAVCFAMENRIPIILIDKEDDYKFKFYDYQIGDWRPLYKKDLFYVKLGFTGIGSREIDIEKSRVAINKILDYIL